MYLSIDVGIKNLAYCMYEETIVDWKVIELCDKTVNANKLNMVDLSKRLFDALETLPPRYDLILIENQIGQNAIRMKALQGMITLYFVSKGNTARHYWNATNKLKMFVKEKTTYAQRKKLGIVITRQIIEEKYKTQLDYFVKHKKKDDLSDCFLQLLDYMKKENKLDPSISQFLETIHVEAVVKK
jgi:hypothetical protein